MNWDQARKGTALLKQKWSTLTNDDLLLLEGTKASFLARLQQRTGLALPEAERQLDALLSEIELDRKHLGVIHLAAD